MPSEQLPPITHREQNSAPRGDSPTKAYITAALAFLLMAAAGAAVTFVVLEVVIKHDQPRSWVVSAAAAVVAGILAGLHSAKQTLKSNGHPLSEHAAMILRRTVAVLICVLVLFVFLAL